MAERRMLHRKVSVSADLAALDAKHGPRAVLFYTWLIPQLDRWGCAPAEPATLLGMVGPLWRDVEPKDVARWLAWMIRRGVLESVEGRNGERGVRVPRFHKHQAGVAWDREGPSLYEPAEITAKWTRDRSKSADTQGGQRPVSERSQTGHVEMKGREGVLQTPSPSLTAVESAAPAASALAGPKPPAPEVEVNHPSAEEIDAVLSPELRAARRRGRVAGKSEQTRREQRAEMDAAALNGAPITEEAARASVEFLRRKAEMEGVDDS